MSPSQPRAATIRLQRVSTVDALAAALREQILEGVLPGGSALREAELHETYAVSRHTVRTALQTLVHEGLVRHEPNRGAYIPEATIEDVVDLYRLRTILELEAAEQIAGDERRLAPAQGALAAMESLSDDAPWGALRDADLAFHRALVDGLESERITRVHASVMSELRLCFMHLRAEFERHDEIRRQHREIVETLAAGNRARGLKLLREHLDRGRDDIQRAATR